MDISMGPDNRSEHANVVMVVNGAGLISQTHRALAKDNVGENLQT